LSTTCRAVTASDGFVATGGAVQDVSEDHGILERH
jgi:hypothetical protein